MNDPGEVLLDLRDWSLVRDGTDGPRTILSQINLSVRHGEWVGILGANGSGKTSLLRYLAGEYSPLRTSCGLVFQDPDESFVAGSVSAELSLGHEHVDAARLLSEYGLTDTADLDPRLLSAGEKQRLNLAVIEALQPAVLCCDEPSSLQDDRQTQWLHDRLRRWRAHTGGTIVMTTQDRDEAALADRLVVLENGRIVTAGPVGEVLDHAAAGRIVGPATAPANTGATGDRRGDSRDTGLGAGEPVARWQGLACRFGDSGRGFSGVDLDIRAGDRIGVVGPNGCGKSTLLAVAAGVRPPDAGTCLLAGRRLYRRRGFDLDHGAALLAPQFPEYLFTRTTVAEEIALDPALASHEPGDLLARVGLPAALAGCNPHALSSGQRRRLALALTVLSRRPLILLDEPSAALDRDGTARLLELLATLPRTSALVIASHDRTLLAACGCTILRLEKNRLAATEAGY